MPPREEPAMPKYQEIFLSLVQKIRSGVYPVGSLLPGEFHLMKEYGVSRDTIRKTLSLLSRHGYIEKSRGRGSVITLPKSVFSSGYGRFSFSEICAGLGVSISTAVLSIRPIMPDVFLCDIMGLQKNAPLHEIVRVRSVDGMPVVVEKNILNGSVFPCPDHVQAENSLFYFIETSMNQPISSVRRTIECCEADELDCTSLKLPAGSLVVVDQSLTLKESGVPLMLTIAHHNPKYFHFEEFLQRKLRL